MFKNKIVFVSGGTGYLGTAICKKFSEYGAKVVFSYYKNEANAKQLQKELNDSEAIKINLKDLNDIRRKIDELYRNVETVDVLVNNAGVSQVMPFSMMEEDDFDFLNDVNIKGTVFLTKVIIRRMIKYRNGVVINIGSIAGHRMLDVPVHYALTKSAMAGFTFSLAMELKRFSIRVNNIIPGMLDDGVSKGIPEELKTAYLKHCATGRPGTGEEVAEVVCFLASNKARYVNGQNIFVDGGI